MEWKCGHKQNVALVSELQWVPLDTSTLSFLRAYKQNKYTFGVFVVQRIHQLEFCLYANTLSLIKLSVFALCHRLLLLYV